MIRAIVLCLLACALAVSGTAPPSDSHASSVFPSTPAGRLAADFVSAFNSEDHAAMREFFTRHLSEAGAKQRPAEERANRWKQMKQDLRSLGMVRVKASGDDSIVLLARNGAGEWVELTFECEPGGAGMLAGIRIEQTQAPGAEEAGPRLTPAELLRAVDATVDSVARADQFSGVVLLARDGRPILGRACGLAEKRFRAPNRGDTRFNLGSINKIFTRVAIGQLVEQKKLSLSDPVGKYLNDFPPEIADRVTIAQLLDMSSGMGDFFGPEYDAMNKSNLRTLRDYFPLFAKKPLEFEPGTDHRYSNAGYVTLGAVIERVTGQDYADYMRDHVWKAAVMESTGFFESDAPEPNVAMGYTRRLPGHEDSAPPRVGPRRENIFSRPARGSSAGGGYSTAGDLLRFANALQAGRLLGAGWTRWMFTGEAPGGAESAAASAAASASGKGGFGFAGGAPGLNALLEIDSESGYTLIVLSNYDPPSAEELGRGIRRLLKRAAP